MISDPTPSSAQNLDALRKRLHGLGVDAFLLSRTDPRGAEYMAPRYERVARLTGFDGSAGTLLVLPESDPESARLFVDGRYGLQARDQTDPAALTVVDAGDRGLSALLAEYLPIGLRVGYDPELVTVRQINALRAALPDRTWVPLPENPADAVCPAPADAAETHEFEHPLRYAGRTRADKAQEAAAAVRAAGGDAVFLTDAASISWLLNRRATGVPCFPAVAGYGLLYADAAIVRLPDLSALPDLNNKNVLLDEASASEAVHAALTAAGAKIIAGEDPCLLPRACKNDAELAGMRAAHVRDGAALWQVLCRVDRGEARSEIEVGELCRSLREAGEHWIDRSFDPICGHASNGAVVHYRASARTDQALTLDTLLLIDSGGHYLDGTTDVTRTVALGTPSPDMRAHYTRVLRGHLALADVVWPAHVPVTGAHLDVLARLPLWQAGLDYAHGTGHGVGMCLSVHEGPQSISLRSKVVLRAGMVLSNEPGYYAAGEYGIRIENLQAVVPCIRGGVDMLGFETLTLVPYDRRLIVREMLSAAEIAQIDAYHASVCTALTPLLPEMDALALAVSTAPL